MFNISFVCIKIDINWFTAYHYLLL